MSRSLSLCALLLASACAPTSLRSARQMGLEREGGARAEAVELLRVDVEVHSDPPLTLPRGPELASPVVLGLDGDALRATVVDTAQRVGVDFGVSVSAERLGTAEQDLPQQFSALLDQDRPAAMTLTVNVAWCPGSDGWVACVRSPDTALGYGPPAIEGFIYSRLKAKGGSAIARRSAYIYKSFVYTIDPSGAHMDRPFIGEGATTQAQAEDAVAQAVDAWLTVARGRRGQRVRRAATTD